MSDSNIGDIEHYTLNVASLLIAKVLRAPLWLLLSALLARVLEPKDLGTLSMIMAAANFLNQLLLLWTQSITQRFGRIEWVTMQQLDGTWATRWPFLAIGFSITLLLLVFTPLNWPLLFYGLTNKIYWYILPALLVLWLMSEAQGLQQVRERFAVMAWSPVLSDMILLIVLGLLLAISRQGKIELHLVLLCVLLTGVINWSLWLINELRSIRCYCRWPTHAAFTRAGMFAAPLLPGFLIGYLAEWGDYFLIRHFYSAHEVGLFHPAYQYLLIMVGLPTALASVLLPRIVAGSDSSAGSEAAVRRLIVRQAPQFTVLWAVPILFVSAILPALLCWLLGASYAASSGLLQILLLAVPGAIVQHIFGVACFAQGRLAMSTLGLFGAKSTVNLALSLFLLPLYGVTGSAIGSAVSYLVLQWLFLLDQQRYLGVRVTASTTAITLLAVQAAAFAQLWGDGLLARLLITLIVTGSLLVWIRRAALFSTDEVSALIPIHLRYFEKVLHRLLCNTP